MRPISSLWATRRWRNRKRLTSVKKYLNNLGTYIGRIEDNIREGNRYEDNIEIWENDVQIVTSLVGDTMSRYIYYEIRGIQESRQQYQDFFVNMIRFCIDPDVVFIFILLYSAEYYKTYQTTDPGDRSGGERGSDGTIGCDRRIGGPGAQRFYEYHDRQDQ